MTSRFSTIALLTIIIIAAGPGAANAQTMPGMQHSPATTPNDRASQAYKDAMDKMHMGMPEPTGEPDRDFVQGMIPHHQGAIDMAQVELKYGKNAQLKKLARDIVAAQRKEIAFMNAWLQKHPAQAGVQ
jgi:uncharacterized protein (DUF305 family)